MVFLKKFFDDGNDGVGFGGGAPVNPFEGANKGDITFGGTPTVTEEDEAPVINDKVEDVAEVEDEAKEPEVKEEAVEVKKKDEDADAEVEEKDEKSVTTNKEAEVVENKPQFNFDDELKKADKYETLKKLGFDDFEIGLLKYKEQTGDVTPYLEAKTTDYSKFSDEQMMKYDLKNQYKGISDKSFEQLYKQEVTDKYILDAEVHGEAAAELGLELLKLKANKVRESAVAEQAKFKAPEKQVDDSAQKQQQAYEDKIKEYKEYVNENVETKALLKDKKLVFGTGDSVFNYKVENPQSLLDTAINPQAIFNSLVDSKGNVDVAKFYKAAAYVANMDKIEEMLIKHGMTLGTKKEFEALQNPSKKDAKSAAKAEPELTPAQAMAKFGKIRERTN